MAAHGVDGCHTTVGAPASARRRGVDPPPRHTTTNLRNAARLAFRYGLADGDVLADVQSCSRPLDPLQSALACEPVGLRRRATLCIERRMASATAARAAPAAAPRSTAPMGSGGVGGSERIPWASLRAGSRT